MPYTGILSNGSGTKAMTLCLNICKSQIFMLCHQASDKEIENKKDGLIDEIEKKLKHAYKEKEERIKGEHQKAEDEMTPYPKPILDAVDKTTETVKKWVNKKSPKK